MAIKGSFELQTAFQVQFFTHQGTWDYCQQFLQVLFASVEQKRIQRQAAKTVLEPNGQPSTNAANIQQVLPNTRPPWDPNTDQGKEALQRYRQLLLQGLRSAAR